MAGKGRIENLKPWKPGESGNLSGRPKRRPITDEYFSRANEPLPEKLCVKLDLPVGTTWAQAQAAMQFLESVENRSTSAAKEIREAIEGKAPQRLEITGPERKEVTIKIIYDRNQKCRSGSSS